MYSNLKDIFQIQKFLDNIRYPDSTRISEEIYQYVNQNKVTQEEIFKRLRENEPWEYIKGYATFCNNEFIVTKDTLIPRIETEQLVYKSIEYIKKKDIKNIIDVGTGSGCIAISIALLIPSAVYATDISKDALEVAKRNELKILKKKSIHWIEDDLIESIPNLSEPTMILANLPYIPTQQYKELDRSVLDYEPQIALEGGKTGLELYKRLFEQIKGKDINIKGIYLETEDSIYRETNELINQYFKEYNIQRIKDCFNRNRFFFINC
jgi:release factor glutamine methyltransferase